MRRCAVTSRDGVSVNERFARAEDFLVFQWAGEGVTFVERRPRPSGDPRAPGHLEALADLLADCPDLLSLQFVGAARRFLIGKGFALHEVRGPIESVVGEILSQATSSAGTPRPAASQDSTQPEEPAS